MASFFDTSTKKDGAVFWSGNKQGAMDYAANNNRTMLEQTPDGQVFDGWNSLSKVLPDWDAVKIKQNHYGKLCLNNMLMVLKEA